MRILTVVLLATGFLCGVANADPCDVLIDTAQTALAHPGVSDDQRIQLESILKQGLAAKSAGDVRSCEAAMTSTIDKAKLPMSVPEVEGPTGVRGHKCEKSLNSV
jgi:hypothetical protein